MHRLLSVFQSLSASSKKSGCWLILVWSKVKLINKYLLLRVDTKGGKAGVWVVVVG